MPFGASYSCSVDLTEEACNARLEEENGNICIMRLTSFLPGVTFVESGKQQRKHSFYWSVRGSVRGGSFAEKANHVSEKNCSLKPFKNVYT